MQRFTGRISTLTLPLFLPKKCDLPSSRSSSLRSGNKTRVKQKDRSLLLCDACSRESEAEGEAGGMQGEKHSRVFSFFIIHDSGVRVGGAETCGQTLRTDFYCCCRFFLSFLQLQRTQISLSFGKSASGAFLSCRQKSPPKLF